MTKGGEALDRRALMLRLPESLHTRLVREAGEQTAKTGKRVTLNQLIVHILESYFQGRARRR